MIWDENDLDSCVFGGLEARVVNQKKDNNVGIKMVVLVCKGGRRWSGGGRSKAAVCVVCVCVSAAQGGGRNTNPKWVNGDDIINFERERECRLNLEKQI